GDFFSFHPLRLRSGAYLTSRDYMADRVVLDEEMAWALFGSVDVAGMEVTIGERSYAVAGVVCREDDFASELAYTGGPGMFMSIEALRLLQEVPIDCYEVVLPDPISGFAKKTVEDKFPVGNGIVVENSSRYSLVNLGKVLLDFGKRSMNTHAVIYPYWENAARLVEDYAALLLLLAVLLAICPVVFAVIVLLRWLKRSVTSAKDKIVGAIDEKVEANNREHYVPGGI
ncbi:MAG: ABC transporter permease, partial [Clostridia bacterium]|nr:ABC transporter permease [Clostridia bacterium]